MVPEAELEEGNSAVKAELPTLDDWNGRAHASDHDAIRPEST
jgi:hypothetical protein